jgi:hypothetical protein
MDEHVSAAVLGLNESNPHSPDDALILVTGAAIQI